jgi:hypothetical protein
MVMEMAETLFHMARCLHRTVTEMAETLFRMDPFLRPMVMVTAVICVSYSFSFRIEDYSGLRANPIEAGVYS